MKLHQNSWPATEKASRYKLFSEVVLELVHRSSWDSYRSHTLSTSMKVRELLKSLAKVRRKEVGKPALEPQISELCYAIDNDPIFRKIVADKNLPFSVFSFSISESIEKLNTIGRMLIDVVSVDYQSCCESELIRLLAEDGSKIKIITITKLYISHLINIGYNEEYIYNNISKIFYQDEIRRCTPGLVKKFFDCFPRSPRVFDVLFCCNYNYAKFLNRQFNIEFHDNIDELKYITRKSTIGSFGEGANKRIVSIRNITTKDAYSAVRSAEIILSLSRSFLYLHPENVSAIVDDVAFVVEGKSKEITRVGLDKGFVPRRLSRSRRDNAESISGLTSYVFSDVGPRSELNEGRRRIFSSLNSASLAAKTGDPESRLLSMWSAFEALLPDPMKDGEGVVRVVYFNNLITPCAVFNYLPSTFSECFRNCRAQFGDSFLRVVTDVGVGATDVEKFASIFAADQASKAEICATVAASPLMLMRFHRLEKLIADPKNACKYLESHERRVGWQINRIYRERNGIVHKADPSPFLNGLIENAYAYYRSVILSLEKIYSIYKIAHPDQGLEMIKVLFDDYKSNLRKISEDSKMSTAEKSSEFVGSMFSRCINY